MDMSIVDATVERLEKDISNFSEYFNFSLNDVEYPNFRTIDDISSDLLCLFPENSNIAFQLIKDFDCYDAGFIRALFKHDLKWVDHLLPFLEQRSEVEIKDFIFLPYLDGHFDIGIAEKLCAISLFKKHFCAKFIEELRLFDPSGSEMISKEMSVDDLFWLIDVSAAPVHSIQSFVANSFKTRDDHWMGLALELAQKYSLSETKFHKFKIGIGDFSPDQIDLSWFQKWEQALGEISLSLINEHFYFLFCSSGHSWAAEYVYQAAHAFPNQIDQNQIVMSNNKEWRSLDSIDYIKKIQQLWLHWMVDSANRRANLKSYAPYIDPVVFDVVLAPVLSPEDMSFMLAQNISDDVRSLPNTLRHILATALEGDGQPPQLRKM